MVFSHWRQPSVVHSDNPDVTHLLCPRGQFLLMVPKPWPFQIQNRVGNVVACLSTVCTHAGCRWRPEGQSPFLISAWCGWENVWLRFVDHETSPCIRQQYLREKINSLVSRNKYKKKKNRIFFFFNVLWVSCPSNEVSFTSRMHKGNRSFSHPTSYFCRCLVKLSQIFQDTVPHVICSVKINNVW